MDIKLGAIVLDTDDAESLATFYAALPGRTGVTREGEWVVLRDQSGGGLPLVFQQVDGYRRPVWPAIPGEQQQMQHLDLYVDDVAAGVDHALRCGAVRNPVQLEKDWCVMLDPAGHPFCILPNTPPGDGGE